LRNFVKRLDYIIKTEFLISSNFVPKLKIQNKDQVNKLFEEHFGSIDNSKFERLFTQYNINRAKKKQCKLVNDKNKRDWFYIEGN
jgi:hypothetical protein